MPPDIDPRSGFRLPLLKREDLNDAGKRAYDRANTPGKTLVGLRGPAGIRLYSTGTIEAHNAINSYLRFEAGFDAKIREIAILTVAREMDSRFEWAAHEPEALQAGVPQDVIDVIKHRKTDARLERNRRSGDRFRPPSAARSQGHVCGVRAGESLVHGASTRRSRFADGQLRRHRGAARRL